MLRQKVSQGNLIALHEEAQKNERGYLKRLFAQMQVEDPWCAKTASTIADNARAQLVEDGTMTPDELHRLVVDACMFVLRVRELADIEGDKKVADTIKVLMLDPEMDTLEPSRIEAIVHATMFYSKIGVTIKKPEGK